MANGWGDNTAGEMAEKLNSMVDQPEEEIDAPEDESVTAGDEPEETDDKGAEKEEPPDRKAGEGGSKKKEDADKPSGVIEVRGKLYTLDELEEAIDGSVQATEHARRTRDVEQRAQLLDTLMEQNKTMLQQLTALITRREAATEDGEETETAAEARQIKELEAKLSKQDETLEELRGTITSGNEERAADEMADFIVSNVESTLSKLFDEHEIPRNLRGIYKNAVIGANPSAADPKTGEVSARSIERAITREFLKQHHMTRQEQKEELGRRIEKLKAPAAPAPKPPLKTKPKGPSTYEGFLGKSTAIQSWDQDGNIREVVERANAKSGE